MDLFGCQSVSVRKRMERNGRNISLLYANAEEWTDDHLADPLAVLLLLSQTLNLIHHGKRSPSYYRQERKEQRVGCMYAVSIPWPRGRIHAT